MANAKRIICHFITQNLSKLPFCLKISFGKLFAVL